MPELNKPSITTHPKDDVVCEGKDVKLSSVAVGYPEPIVQWEVQSAPGALWVPEPGATKAELTPEGATRAELTLEEVAIDQDGARFRAVFSNRAGSAPTHAARVTVHSHPRVTQQPVSQEVEVGANVEFAAEADGNPPPTVVWQRKRPGAGTKWTTLESQTSTRLVVKATGGGDGELNPNGARYRAKFSNKCADGDNTVLSDEVTLTVVDTPDALPADQRTFHLLAHRLTEATVHLAGLDSQTRPSRSVRSPPTR